jgi:hypothetical protein
MNMVDDCPQPSYVAAIPNFGIHSLMGQRGWRMLRLLLLWTVCVLSVLAVQGAAFAQEPQPVGGVSSLGGPVLTTGQLLGSEPVANAEEAELASPNAVAERTASRTRYAGLNRDQAVALAEKVFHIERSSWTAPGSTGEGNIESI